MSRLPGFVNVFPAIPVLLVHLVGVVVAIILLVRREKGSASAVLALIGFALLIFLDVANFARGPLINLVSRRAAMGIRALIATVGCCCSVFEVAAVVCLIIAIWRALSSPDSAGADK